MISVICPIYNEQKYIAKCIESILEQDYPQGEMEVLFVDGMSTDATRDIVKSYSEKYPYIRLLDNPNKIVPYAMNIGIQKSMGDIIIRLDAHAIFPSNYLSCLTKRLVELDADNIGCVCKTDVLNKTPKTLAISEVLGNTLGVGNSVFRTGTDDVREVDTVPFGCWKREVFKKYGLYDVRLVRNQDIELNKRIIRGGGKIYIIPDTYCTYLARETFKGISKNNYGNGKWNILTVYYTKQFNSLSLRHFIPLMFMLSLLVPILLAFIWLPIGLVSLVSLIAYCSLIGYVSLRLSVNKKLNFGYLLWSFIVLHISYGWGSLAGIVKFPFLDRYHRNR